MGTCFYPVTHLFDRIKSQLNDKCDHNSAVRIENLT